MNLSALKKAMIAETRGVAFISPRSNVLPTSSARLFLANEQGPGLSARGHYRHRPKLPPQGVHEIVERVPGTRVRRRIVQFGVYWVNELHHKSTLRQEAQAAGDVSEVEEFSEHHM